jgi:ketosteroid isomerase-like protein
MNNVETLRAAHNAMADRDPVPVTAMMRPDVVVHGHAAGQTFNSVEEFMQFLDLYYSMSSDIRLVDGEYIAAGDKVIAQFRAVGTQDGPFLGFPASGRPFSLDVAEIWTFNDEGYAIEGHNYTDILGLLMQLGHIAVPA